MMNINVFRKIPTVLDLNGPTLKVNTQPEDVTLDVGASPTVVGVVTAFFPNRVGEVSVNGTVNHQWHEVGVGALSDTSVITGTATTELSFSTIVSPDDDGRQFFVRSTFTPTAPTGDAANEPVDSNTVTFTVNPTISITNQPSSRIAPINTAKTFTVVAASTQASKGDLSYQWSLNGSEIDDGDITTEETETVTKTITTGADGWNGSGIYLDLTSFGEDSTVNVTFNTSEESGIFHYINIPGVKNFPENNGSQSFNLTGGRVYGPCNAPNGNLYIGNETPVGGNQTLVVEEGGDDWNDMILTSSKGYFRRLSSSPQTTTTTTETITITKTTTVSGTKGPTLTIESDHIADNELSVTVSQALASNSPITSNTVDFNVVGAEEANRQRIAYEIVRDDFFTELYDSGEQNIFEAPLTYQSDTENPTKTFVIYPTERDLPVQITLAGSAGQKSGDILGGQGGKTIFNYTLLANTEYVFKLLPPQKPFGGNGGGGGSALFYAKGVLIAACGGGGGAVPGIPGGNGGGVGLDGEDGIGPNSGAGAIAPVDGGLTLESIDPANFQGGRMTSCTLGEYYQYEGFAPCQDVGQQPFRNAVGTETEGTSSTITRGYKSGQSSKFTGGDSSTFVDGVNVGGGGAGAVGGNATEFSDSSGGGGAGYNNGDAVIIENEVGGNPASISYFVIETQP